MTFVEFINKQTGPKKLTEAEMVEKLRGTLSLFGSRYFKEKNERERWFQLALDFSTVDDWDFSFSQTDLVPWIESLGFVRQEIGRDHMDVYSDVTFVGLWKHPDYKIDIVQRTNYDKYKKVWESTDPDFYHKYLWKSAPHRSRDQEEIGKHKVFIRDWLNDQINRF